jgi:hypothetical protein
MYTVKCPNAIMDVAYGYPTVREILDEKIAMKLA